MVSAERTEVRAVIKFYRDIGKTPTQTYKLMKSTPGRSTVSRSLVFKWFKRFEDGRTSLQEEEGRGRKPKINQRLVTSVHDALKEERRLTVRNLAEKFVPMDYFLWHQDIASPHTAESTRLEINLIGFGTVSHPPYSPNLAPMDFSFFPAIKKQLKGRKFKSLPGLRVAVKTIVSQFDEQWYKNMFDQWVQRHHPCILHRGEYFEKK